MKLRVALLIGACWASATGIWAQDDEDTGRISGNVQILWQSYAEDSLIGAVVPPEKTGYNAYANLLYQRGNFSAGMRYESYLNAVIGFPGRF